MAAAGHQLGMVAHRKPGQPHARVGKFVRCEDPAPRSRHGPVNAASVSSTHRWPSRGWRATADRVQAGGQRPRAKAAGSLLAIEDLPLCRFAWLHRIEIGQPPFADTAAADYEADRGIPVTPVPTIHALRALIPFLRGDIPVRQHDLRRLAAPSARMLSVTRSVRRL